MASWPTCEIYFRTLPTFKLRLWIFLLFNKHKHLSCHNSRLCTWSFKYRGKNHCWIYWIKIYDWILTFINPSLLRNMGDSHHLPGRPLTLRCWRIDYWKGRWKMVQTFNKLPCVYEFIMGYYWLLFNQVFIQCWFTTQADRSFCFLPLRVEYHHIKTYFERTCNCRWKLILG